jgi:hypothetical protein
VDSISAEALDGLTAAIQSLLPPPANPNLAPAVSVQPITIYPTGLGGFVAINDNPVGEIIGRRIDATVVVGVRASANAIDGAASAVINALLTADRATLLGLGLLRLALDKVGDAAPGPSSAIQQPVSFRVLYEYLKKPAEAEGIIHEIPLNIQLQQ